MREGDVEPSYAALRRLLGRHAEEPAHPYRTALRALTELRPSLDRVEASLVDHARLAGATWAELAQDLGTSRPTAQRRHVAHDPVATRRRKRREQWEQIFGGS